ncbi:TerC family protein [Anaplasma bovis]|uniref:TerC family protein n=1 Tax=Anaplasma bovis TaxID=186733 RepID=UPI002FF41C0E
MHYFANTALEFSTLLVLEMILGVDNLIFISIVTKRLPQSVQNKVRICGLSLALIMRFAMLHGASYLSSINEKSLSFLNVNISYHDAFLIAGGIFLIFKSTKEICEEIFKKSVIQVRKADAILPAVLQIIGIDIVLSIDSVISGIGITDKIILIEIVFFIYTITAILLSKGICETVHKHNSLKIIALLFIGLLGILLALEGVGIYISHKYLYSMLALSIMVEAGRYLWKQRLRR